MFYILFFIIGLGIGIFFSRRHFSKSSLELSEMAEEGRKAVKRRIIKRKEKIMTYARSKGRVVNDDVEDMFCISDNTARRYLNALEEEGKLEQVGASGRGVYYTPKNPSNAQQMRAF